MQYWFQVLNLIFLVSASTEYFPRGTKLKWYFPTQQEVTFQWWVPQTTIQYYGWVGLAFQDVRDPRDNFVCDYYISLTAQGQVMGDYWADSNGLPPSDQSLGGTNDLQSDRTSVDNYQIFIFTRKLDTGDQFDVVLEIGRPFLIKWAMGPVDQEQNIEMHTLEDMGFEYLVLIEDYDDRNHDQRAKYGPWLEMPPQVMEPPEDQFSDLAEWSEDLFDQYARPVESSEGEYASLDEDEVEEESQEEMSEEGSLEEEETNQQSRVYF